VSVLARWWFAAKPASWPKLLVPFVLGQSIGLDHGGSIRALAIGLAFTIFDLGFIVFLNDWGDREVDAIKRRMYGDRSGKKTIPDGILSAPAVLIAGLSCGACAIAVAFAGELLLDRPGLGALAVFALAMFGAYTFGPIKLNYRGGGELLEMTGVGVVLPWLHAYLQGGVSHPRGLSLLWGFALFSLSSAIASGLADERSDRRGQKRTFVTTFGNAAARRAIELFAFAGAGAWGLLGFVSDALPWWLSAIPALLAMWHLGAAFWQSEAAQTDAFDAQRRYKTHLHRAIWRGALCASILLAWWHLSR
jgi:1,4-dihydroxy-2-naphthoate octaprenyltransferase